MTRLKQGQAPLDLLDLLLQRLLVPLLIDNAQPTRLAQQAPACAHQQQHLGDIHREDDRDDDQQLAPSDDYRFQL